MRRTLGKQNVSHSSTRGQRGIFTGLILDEESRAKIRLSRGENVLTLDFSLGERL